MKTKNNKMKSKNNRMNKEIISVGKLVKEKATLPDGVYIGEWVGNNISVNPTNHGQIGLNTYIIETKYTPNLGGWVHNSCLKT